MTSGVLPRAACLAATLVIVALPRGPPRAGGPAGQGCWLEQEPARPRRGTLRPRPAGLGRGAGCKTVPSCSVFPHPVHVPAYCCLDSVLPTDAAQGPTGPAALSAGDFWEEPPAARPLTSRPLLLPQTLGCWSPGLLPRASPAPLPHTSSEGPGVVAPAQPASSERACVTSHCGGQSVTPFRT